jgi:hypothetical protein
MGGEKGSMWRSGNAGRVGGKSGRIGRVQDIVDELTPGVCAAGVDDLVLRDGDGVEEKLAHESESGGVAGRKTVLGDGGEEFSEDVIDVDSSKEFTGRRLGDVGADGFGLEKLALDASMEQAERGVAVLAEHAAFAAVGEMELAKMRMIGGGAFFGHGSSFVEAMKQGSKDVTKNE